MEEVVGSIPTRSTKSLKKFDGAEIEGSCVLSLIRAVVIVVAFPVSEES